LAASFIAEQIPNQRERRDQHHDGAAADAVQVMGPLPISTMSASDARYRVSSMHTIVLRPIRFKSPPVEVDTGIQSEVAEGAQRGKSRNNCRKPAEVVGCLTAIDARWVTRVRFREWIGSTTAFGDVVRNPCTRSVAGSGRVVKVKVWSARSGWI
jgi:hypothetical protein